jgi:hydroxymethylpyrimidine pyrophosphatase-like HAD family hydrolase
MKRYEVSDMFAPRAIAFCDFDKTCRPYDGAVSPQVVAAMQRLTAKDIMVVIVSGQSAQLTCGYFAAHGLDAKGRAPFSKFIIAGENGGFLLDYNLGSLAFADEYPDLAARIRELAQVIEARLHDRGFADWRYKGMNAGGLVTFMTTIPASSKSSTWPRLKRTVEAVLKEPAFANQFFTIYHERPWGDGRTIDIGVLEPDTKVWAVQKIWERYGKARSYYIGDGINDLRAMQIVTSVGGRIACPQDSHAAVLDYVRAVNGHICSKTDGDAVVEFLDSIIL